MNEIGRIAKSVEAAQKGNKRMEDMIESKCLSFNLDKTNVLVFGHGNLKKKIQKQLKKEPLTLCG